MGCCREGLGSNPQGNHRPNSVPHTGEEPDKTPVVSRLLDQLASEDARVKSLVGRYYSRQTRLHGDCFYTGITDGIDEIERRIRETDLYLRDAEALA